MSAFLDLLNDIASDRVDKEDSLKRCSGVVESIVDNTDGGKAVVRCMNRSLTLLNKTGEILEVGDSVWVHYWGNLANGYIALRNGLPNSRGGGGGSFHITNAVAMLETQASLYTVATEVVDVDVENAIRVKYGDPENIIIASQIPIIVSNYNNTNTIAEIYSFVSAIQSGLLSTERIFDDGTNTVGIYTSVIGTYNGSWLWGADVLYQSPRTIQNVNGSNIYNICLSNDNYTLRKSDGTKAYFSTFTELGFALLTSEIQSPTTEMPYGYAVCKAVCIAKYDNDNSATAISKISARTINIPFESEAEYNYAVCTLTRSEIVPSNGGD